ncbi:odorant receptor 30a-like [Anthonomus grandis grandis]|uniref:odorant receptor 30a-like n=1 Tax=Anthonomus grandis grandis TaxID=2921223 RepID=UPI0021664F29|nr:odorant receptor 30a-like [Anthonomus grandis grandis]XP_050312918.1 odorant receptor 30a-like [Anthonomus grandis grandis]
MSERSIYKLTKFFMTAIGLWGKFETKQAQKWYRIYGFSTKTIYILYNLSMVVKVTQVALDHSESQNVFGLVSLAALITLVNIKIVVFSFNNVSGLFQHVIDEEGNILLSASSDSDIKRSYLDHCKFYRATSRFQVFTTVVSVYFYIIFNVHKLVSHKLAPGENFMYELWLPFDINENGPVMIVCKLCLSQMGVLFNSCSQVMLQSLMVFVTSQLAILQIRARTMFDRRTGVEALIEKHQFLIGFVSKINEAIKYVILLEYILNSVNIATALLQILMSHSLIEITFSLVYLLLLLSQVMIFGWTASRISTQSFNVSNAVYSSNWTEQSESVKRTLLIVMMRAQKPLTLDIGPFIPMNNEACLTTLKGAYSYAGVMRHGYLQ